MFDDLEAIPVTCPSGATVYVLTENEKEYFENIAEKYLQDNSFKNITDLQDLDRLLLNETIGYRWGLWLLADQDYEGEQLDDPIDLSKQLKENATELRQLKKQMGLDRVSRDKNKGEDISSYIETLRKRAKEFGIMRNEQAVKAITLWKELEALVIFHQNCDETERKEQDIELPDIFEWIVYTGIPEFNEIDVNFRNTTQKYWTPM